MAPVVRTLQVNATPSQIWNACFAPMKWEEWDPDVEALEDISGECANGTTFTFVMIDPSVKRIPVSLSDVQTNATVRYTGAAVQGLMKFEGFLRILEHHNNNNNQEPAKQEEPNQNDDDHGNHDAVATTTSCIIEYSFTMSGLVGSVIHYFNPNVVISGVEKGLENMKRLSET